MAKFLGLILGVFSMFFFNMAWAQEVDTDSLKNYQNGAFVGLYGRIGINTVVNHGRATGANFNLNGMGSRGGRNEEGDYFEFIPGYQFQPNLKNGDRTRIKIALTFAMYSRSSQLITYGSTNQLSGLAFALPEAYIQVDEIANLPLMLWVGGRYTRETYSQTNDYFNFDDHTGQGAGIKYKNTQLMALYVASRDTSDTGPNYFYNGVVNNGQVLELRQRLVLIGEQNFSLGEDHSFKALAEYHQLAEADDNADTVGVNPNQLKSANGWVLGLKHRWNILNRSRQTYNTLTVRYARGIANGGDNGFSRTYFTYGAPDLEANHFNRAYSLSIVESLILEYSEKFSSEIYGLYMRSRGAAAESALDDRGQAENYFGTKVYNFKEEFVVGARTMFHLNNYLHLIAEGSYQSRVNGTDPAASVTKLTLAPTFMPIGHDGLFDRPQIRLVFTLARYNDFAQRSIGSPFLNVVGPTPVGFYVGVKSEWYIGTP